MQCTLSVFGPLESSWWTSYLLGVIAEALQANIDRKLPFLKAVGQFQLYFYLVVVSAVG